MDCVLAVDAGNTVTRFGVAARGVLCATWEISTLVTLTVDEAVVAADGFFRAVQVGLAPLEPGADEALGKGASDAAVCERCLVQPVDGILSSTVPALTDVWISALARLCGQRPLVVGPGLKTGLKMSYHDPSEVGSDRVADMVAAKSTYGAPVLVVDLGTTTNIEVLDAQGVFLGGLIAPGLRLGAAALANAAARLPVVDVRAPRSVVGRSTREAMQAGLVMGEVARIDGLVDMIWRELGYKTSVVLSGTDAEGLGALMSHEVHVDRTLTLRGLLQLHAANRR